MNKVEKESYENDNRILADKINRLSEQIAQIKVMRMNDEKEKKKLQKLTEEQT